MDFTMSSILSIGIILLGGFIAGFLLSKIKIPGLVGMIIVGLLIGPTVLNLISPGIIGISSELRTLALVIILTRSGLNLDIESLKKIGRPAILMSFLPATFEIVGVMLLGMWLLKLSVFESLLLGSVLAAVSPAVVSPRMIGLIEKGYGNKHNVPKLILAGSSVDDIYVIVLFYSFLSLVEKSSFNFLSILGIPFSIITGILLGILVGILLVFILRKTTFKLPINVLIVFSFTLLMLGFQYYIDYLTNDSTVEWISISALLGIIVVGIILLWKLPEKSKELSKGYNSMWTFFEILLFVLVGASLKFTDEIVSNLGFAILVILGGLIFRSCGVLLCLIKTELTFKERIFTMVSYLPKATVQASIGGIAASLGLACGNLILAVSVLSIIITAPLGALGIDLLAPKLLSIENESENKN